LIDSNVEIERGGGVVNPCRVSRLGRALAFLFFLAAAYLGLPGTARAIDHPTTKIGSPADSSVIRQGAVSDSIAAPVSPEARPAEPPVMVPQAPPVERTIQSIRASGFANVDSMVIIKTFGLHPGDTYTSESVRAGVRRLFASGLFTDVNVVDSPQGDGVALNVVVHERNRIKEIKFEGSKKIEESKLKPKLTSAAGQLLDQGTLDLDAGKISDAYAEEGYAHAKVTVRIDPAATGASNVVFVIDGGEKVKVKGVVVHGTTRTIGFNENDLAHAMKSHQGGFLKSGAYKPSQLEDDATQLRLFMRSRGYKDADVDSIHPEFSADGKGVILHVFVREGRRYRFGNIDWIGNTVVPTAALKIGTVIYTGAPYSEAAIHKTLEGAYTLYQEQGFLYLSIDPKFTERDSIVDVDFTIQEGYRSKVADIRIVGNTRTKENVIRREAVVRPGDVFRRSSLIRTQRDIFALGFFQDVNVDYEPAGGDSQDINLTLKVQEKQTGTASAGAGFASSTGITGFLELGHNNLFGNGQSVNLHLERGSKLSTFEFSFTDPWFHDTPLTLGWSLFDTQHEYDVYTRKDVGGGIRFGRPIGWPDYTRGLVSYDLRNVTLSNFAAPVVGESSNLTDLRNTHWPRLVSSVTFTFSRISTDNPFYATRGSKIAWTNTFAGGPLGGVEEFYKGTFDVKNYTKLDGPFTLMLRGRTGFLGGGSVPEYETFRLGGTTVDYLRGYPDYYIVPRTNITKDPFGRVLERYPGGKKMLITGAEIQFPIAEPLHGLFFAEAGNTWDSVKEIDLGDMRRAVGFGVRFEVPALGRIGFDLGYGLDREEGAGWRTHFQLGNTL